MPNKTIYLNTVKNFEKNIGFSFINKEDVEKKLQEAWENDKTAAKLDYLAAYREVFSNVLKNWSEYEATRTYTARAEKMPNFKKCLLKTDETLKTCAMALIPGLRENEDVLSNMTFGNIDEAKLKIEFTSVRSKWLQSDSVGKILSERKKKFVEKYEKEWAQKPIRSIVEKVRDEDTLKKMTKDEKVAFAFALERFRNDEEKRPFDDNEKELIDGALSDWKKAIGCRPTETIEAFVDEEQSEYSQKFMNDEFLSKEVKDAITEFNKTPNFAKQEIARYKELEKTTKERKAAKEKAQPNRNITNEFAESVGDFFMQEELELELTQQAEKKQQHQELPKEREFLYEKIDAFNRKYDLRVSKEKLRSSVEQLTALMIKARDEKEQFLAKNVVVVIENGKETIYQAQEYFKDQIDEAKQAFENKLKKLDEEGLKIEKDLKDFNDKYNKLIEEEKDRKKKENLEKGKEDAQKIIEQRRSKLEADRRKVKSDFDDEMVSFQGGIVVEKDGKTEKSYKSSQYYETHETKKEQYAYGEYQKMFARVYKDACQNTKEKNYPKGKVTDFSAIAKDVDKLFKSALYISNIYDNPKNAELLQKTSFGGFSAEKLSEFVVHLEKDSWKADQTREEAWLKQATQAKEIYASWNRQQKYKPKVNISDTISKTLKTKRVAYQNGKISRKEFLDYVLAGDTHLLTAFSTRRSRIFGMMYYTNESKTLQDCRAALGLKEGDSLRVAMNKEYERLSKTMSKEDVFKSIRNSMDNVPTLKDEKSALTAEHKAVQDRITAEKKATLERLKEKGKEPISISQLDERNLILNQKPRSQPVSAPSQLQQSLVKN